MSVYKITYNTLNTYTPPVHEATLDFLILPESSDDQEILDIDVNINHMGSYYWTKNSFGFDILRCRITSSTNLFKLKLTATVIRDEIDPFAFTQLNLEEEQNIIESPEFSIDNYLYLKTGGYTQTPEGFNYPVRNDKERIFDFAKKVNDYVHDLLKYDSNITDTKRTLKETINEKRGVCQDFAHLMLGILRMNNIPCRYISGYLNQGEEILGAAAIHAWVQVLIPGVGWVGFDPTNDLIEDHHYIKIAHGIDLNDCTNVKGVIKGAGTNQTDYQVLVEKQSKEINQ